MGGQDSVVSVQSRRSVKPPTLDKNRGARLIAFDGGGVKGISSLLILDTIMDRVKDLEIKNGTNTSTEPRLPVNYFHLAAGTSTGGLIAVMLFRLHMNCKEAMQVYTDLAKNVFCPTFFDYRLDKLGSLGQWFGEKWVWVKAVFKDAKFSDVPLKAAIDTVIKEHGLDDEDRKEGGAAKLQHPDSGKLIMCATLADKGESILFRSYDRPARAKPVTGKVGDYIDLVDDIDISTAARATSAAPMYLPQVSFPEDPKVAEDKKLVFWDGGLLNNNPIDQLWNARYDLVGKADPPPKVDLIVSIGCSWNKAQANSAMQLVNQLTKATAFLTNTEAKNRDFQRYVNVITGRGDMNNNVVYERLNTPTDQEVFDLADYTKMDALKALTLTYLKSEDAESKIAPILDILVPKAT